MIAFGMMRQVESVSLDPSRCLFLGSEPRPFRQKFLGILAFAHQAGIRGVFDLRGQQVCAVFFLAELFGPRFRCGEEVFRGERLPVFSLRS